MVSRKENSAPGQSVFLNPDREQQIKSEELQAA
jgi:hypothetical protein